MLSVKQQRMSLTARSGVPIMRRLLLTAGMVVLLLGTVLAAAEADSLSFFGQNSGWYLYLGSASGSDTTWSVGDTVTLTGMDKLTDALTPSSFSAVFDQFTATWTCVQATSGFQFFGVMSAEGAGTVPWSIISSNSNAGTVTGPEYVPEPATTAMFSVGLLALGVGMWRRRTAAAH